MNTNTYWNFTVCISVPLTVDNYKPVRGQLQNSTDYGAMSITIARVTTYVMEHGMETFDPL